MIFIGQVDFEQVVDGYEGIYYFNRLREFYHLIELQHLGKIETGYILNDRRRNICLKLKLFVR